MIELEDQIRQLQIAAGENMLSAKLFFDIASAPQTTYYSAGWSEGHHWERLFNWAESTYELQELKDEVAMNSLDSLRYAKDYYLASVGMQGQSYFPNAAQGKEHTMWSYLLQWATAEYLLRDLQEPQS